MIQDKTGVSSKLSSKPSIRADATTDPKPKLAQRSGNLDGHKKSVFVKNTELPWFVLVPLVIVLAASEVAIMLMYMKRKDRMREEMDDKVYTEIRSQWPDKGQRSRRRGKRRGDAKTQAKTRSLN